MITPTINGVKTYPDGREICDMKTAEGRREYKRRTLEMAERQKWRDPWDGQFMSEEHVTFDHEQSRGGGKRDDRILKPDGTWQNAAMGIFNNILKGSKRYKWIEGTYQEVSR